MQALNGQTYEITHMVLFRLQSVSDSEFLLSTKVVITQNVLNLCGYFKWSETEGLQNFV